MTDQPRTPWWYSGDESPGESGEPGDPGETRESSDPGETRESSDPGEAAEAGASGASGAGLDWMSLLSGATRMVDWAAAAVVEPHGEHGDPADHPDCLVCRTLALVQDRTGMTGPRPDQPVPADQPIPAEPIRWIPVLD
jgi:hypothetical protein